MDCAVLTMTNASCHTYTPSVNTNLNLRSIMTRGRLDRPVGWLVGPDYSSIWCFSPGPPGLFFCQQNRMKLCGKVGYDVDARKKPPREGRLVGAKQARSLRSTHCESWAHMYCTISRAPATGTPGLEIWTSRHSGRETSLPGRKALAWAMLEIQPAGSATRCTPRPYDERICACQ